MTDCADIAVAVLAAGRGARFGGDKLMADLDGVPLGLHIGQTLGAMGFGWRFAVCRKSGELTRHFSAADFAIIANDHPEAGQAHSLHLAVKAAEATEANALLVVLADMPFVSATHIAALVAAYVGEITASTNGEANMPPAIFPRESWPMLLATSGDAGARELLKRARLVQASVTELRDIDTPADLPASK
ncbi:MAG: nucleotidyltransferase family protein [Sphingorhabdus sp.]